MSYETHTRCLSPTPNPVEGEAEGGFLPNRAAIVGAVSADGPRTSREFREPEGGGAAPRGGWHGSFNHFHGATRGSGTLFGAVTVEEEGSQLGQVVQHPNSGGVER